MRIQRRTLVRLRYINFNKETPVLSDFDFVIIKQICSFSDHNNLDDRLLTREALHFAQLCTLRPHGLNKRSEFNSRNRIRYGHNHINTSTLLLSESSKKVFIFVFLINIIHLINRSKAQSRILL